MRFSMRLPRFYVNAELKQGAVVELPKETSHYVRQVLRLRERSPVILFNGSGGEFKGKISINNKQTTVILEELNDLSVESPLYIHLGQGISRGEKMDYVVQKAVELGVAEITPLFTERCGVRLDDERAEKRLDHWQKIIISACEQSGRNKIPLINAPCEISAWIAQCMAPHRLICHPGLSSDESSLEVKNSVAVLIGSEGGFTEVEITDAMTHGFKSLALGPRVLRTETATVAALTKLQISWGDMR